MKRTILSIALALCVGCAMGQKKDFKQLAKIEGVEHVHINKFLLNLAAKNGGDLDLGESISLGGSSEDFLRKWDDVRVFSTEEKKAAEQMSQRVRSILKGAGWEPLIDMKDEEGQKVKIYQSRQGKQTTVVIFSEEEDETSLVVIKGEIDLAKLMEQEGDSEEKKLSLSMKATTWEDDGEKEPRKFRDCLIVIDGKIYPNLHTQSEAARYIYEHHMEWNGIPQVLEGKEVKKKYPDTKKKVAFEYTTTKNNENI